MFKKLMEKVKDKHLLTLELSEVKEIADLIFKRLNRKVEVLEAIEASVDEKIEILEKLIQKAESLTVSSINIDRKNEIVSLGQKGLKSCDIADILDIPVGEIELVLSLNTKTDYNN